jgi:hypothetical protein
MSARFPCHSKELSAYCVSHPILEDSARFLNDHGNLRPDCVSHRLQAKSGHRRAWLSLGRLAQPQPQPLLFLRRRVLAPPRGARLPMPLALALLVAAHALPVPGARVRLKPASADPARSLAGHHPRASPGLRRSSASASLTAPWVTFHEQPRVISRERSRRRCFEQWHRTIFAKLSCGPRFFDNFNHLKWKTARLTPTIQAFLLGPNQLDSSAIEKSI